MDATTPTKVLVKIGRGMLELVIVLAVTLIASIYFKPIITEPTLSPSGIGQNGWPLAILASYWDDSSLVGGYQANTFNVRNLFVDMLILSIPVFFTFEFLSEYSVHRLSQGRRGSQFRVWALRSGKRIVVVSVSLCLIYVMYALYMYATMTPQPVFPLNL